MRDGDAAGREPGTAAPTLSKVAVEALAETFCFLESHKHTATEPACDPSRRRADHVLVALCVNDGRREAVGQWLLRPWLAEARQQGRDREGAHPESYCHRCGGWNLGGWHAPSPVWNAVMRRNDGPEPFDGIICPQCFEQLAEQFGVIDTERTGWHVHPEPFPDVPLTDADGRAWDPEQCLWVERALASADTETDAPSTPDGPSVSDQSPARQQGREREALDVDEAYAVVEETLRVTAHIPERDIRAKYIVTDLSLDGWLIGRAEAEVGFALYCLCGATMTGSGARSDADVLTGAFWAVHEGDGHGPTTRRKAAVARALASADGPPEPQDALREALRGEMSIIEAVPEADRTQFELSALSAYRFALTFRADGDSPGGAE